MSRILNNKSESIKIRTIKVGKVVLEVCIYGLVLLFIYLLMKSSETHFDKWRMPEDICVTFYTMKNNSVRDINVSFLYFLTFIKLVAK